VWCGASVLCCVCVVFVLRVCHSGRVHARTSQPSINTAQGAAVLTHGAAEAVGHVVGADAIGVCPGCVHVWEHEHRRGTHRRLSGGRRVAGLTGVRSTLRMHSASSGRAGSGCRQHLPRAACGGRHACAHALVCASSSHSPTMPWMTISHVYCVGVWRGAQQQQHHRAQSEASQTGRVPRSAARAPHPHHNRESCRRLPHAAKTGHEGHTDRLCGRMAEPAGAVVGVAAMAMFMGGRALHAPASTSWPSAAGVRAKSCGGARSRRGVGCCLVTGGVC
jgi:hypothetical protein